MKTGKKGKLSFTKERLKFTLRGFAELQFLWPTLGNSLWNVHTAKIEKF